MARHLFLALLAVAGLALVAPPCLAGPQGEAPGQLADGSAQQPAPPPGQASARLALLVGIDRYAPGSPLAPLAGCVRDAERFASLLTARFGFAHEDVLVLRDAEATHAAIVAAFQRHLIGRAGPGTEAMFFFAGHGSRVPDDDPAPGEADGLDSTYLAWDSRAEGREGERDLSDDELRSLVAALAPKGAFATVVTDSCHSGGGLRGPPALSVRAAPPGRRPLDRAWLRTFWPPDLPLLDDAAPDAGAASWVHLAACRRDQLAGEVEVEVEPGVRVAHGALSWHLGQVLAGSAPGDTWESVARQTALRVATALPWQDLAWSGARERVVFGAEFRPVRGFPARSLRSDLLVVDAGWMHGLRQGSRLAIVEEAQAGTLVRAEVEWISPVQARARRIGEPEHAPDGRALDFRALEGRALRALPDGELALGEPPLALWCEDRALAELFVGSGHAVLAPSAAGADLVVRRTDAGLDLCTPEGLGLGTPIALPTPAGEDEREVWTRALEARLARELLWRATSRLALEPGALPLAVRIEPATAAECALPLPEGWKRWVPAEVRDGEALGGLASEGVLPLAAFVVSNPTRETVRLTVLNLPEDARARRVIDPQPGADQRVLAPGATARVLVGLAAPDPWPLERAMLDRYLFLATLAPFDAQALAAESPLRGEEPALPGVLRRALAQHVLRGATRADSGARYGATCVDVRVARPR
jgi:hypothetical protein